MPEPEKSFGEKTLGFFVKEDAKGGAQTGGNPAPSTPSSLPGYASQPSAPLPQAPGPTPQTPGTVDAKFAGHFTDVLTKANVQGPDYFEYRETLRHLADLGLPEDKRYQAAWASFRAMASGVSVQLLTGTANQYLTALSADRDLFLKSVETALNERVGGLQNEQKGILTDNEVATKQISELQKRINANNERLANIGGEITEQSTKLTQNRSNFEATYASFTEQIKNDVSKIQTYLK
ncbi:MAG: hypothetical protein LH609_05915 [Rudanella sp.]|nr:hypothetical protein [Rudanella sp.]